MKLGAYLSTQIEAALTEVLKFVGPADAVLSRFFRANPKLGHQDRGIIAEAVYAVLRRRMEFAHLGESGTGAPVRRLALLGLLQTVGSAALLPTLSPAERSWVERIPKIDPATLPERIRLNLPDWIREALAKRFDAAELTALAAALSYPAPLDCRVNTLKSSREAVLTALGTAGIDANPTLLAPLGVRLAGKPQLAKLPAFENGWIEVQDEGSQLLCALVGAKRGEMVADFCAGAGGKTLALGAAMRSTGRLYAFDVAERRLARLKPRLARSGLSNVHPVLIDSERDAKIKRLAGKMDRVLVDAPCSGLGTLRRNPDLKWRQTPASIDELVVKQAAILAAAAGLVKPGGRLVYATCSLLTAENEDIVHGFLEGPGKGRFVIVPAQEVLAEQRIDLESGEFFSVLPHRHGTDGFFAAVLRREDSVA
ncbi:MAG: RsmB/NOP family class I SAM-dependent RNA methyltransferase [Janthinobacterium lividum]